MKNLFIGGSSEIAKDLVKKLSFSDCISRNNSKLFQNCFKILNYKENQIKKSIKKIKGNYDNILIFNGDYQASFITTFSSKEFDKSFYINFKVPIIFSSELIKNNILKKNGSIFFFSSIAANYNEKGNAYYSLSKNSLNFAAKLLGNEQMKRGIRVNVISLGLINNKMGKSTITFKTKKNIKFLKKNMYINKIIKTLKNKKINQKIIFIK